LRSVEENSAAISISAVLEGGPPTLPEAMRTQTVSAFAQKIKIPHYGGYEHFERTAECEENTSANPIVFRWTMRTEVAE
jgi:Family of unknown function (DUF5988)